MSEAVALFESLFAEHGDSPRALDWSAEGQRERFQVLTEIGIGPRASVLDVGCGLGHFRDWIRTGIPDKVCNPGGANRYIGVDASPQMTDAAFRRVGGISRGVEFLTLDALRDPLPPADYVVSSGMLNVEEWSNEANMRTLLRRCFDACRIGAAVNMLSARAPNKRPDRHCYDPAAMLVEALTITPRVTLRHDYRDNDFTLYLYRGAA